MVLKSRAKIYGGVGGTINVSKHKTNVSMVIPGDTQVLRVDIMSGKF